MRIWGASMRKLLGAYYADVGCIYADVGCLYAEAFGCIYADVGCIYADVVYIYVAAFGCIYADVVCIYAAIYVRLTLCVCLVNMGGKPKGQEPYGSWPIWFLAPGLPAHICKAEA